MISEIWVIALIFVGLGILFLGFRWLLKWLDQSDARAARWAKRVIYWSLTGRERLMLSAGAALLLGGSLLLAAIRLGAPTAQPVVLLDPSFTKQLLERLPRQTGRGPVSDQDTIAELLRRMPRPEEIDARQSKLIDAIRSIPASPTGSSTGVHLADGTIQSGLLAVASLVLALLFGRWVSRVGGNGSGSSARAERSNGGNPQKKTTPQDHSLLGWIGRQVKKIPILNFLAKTEDELSEDEKRALRFFSKAWTIGSMVWAGIVLFNGYHDSTKGADIPRKPEPSRIRPAQPDTSKIQCHQDSSNWLIGPFSNTLIDRFDRDAGDARFKDTIHRILEELVSRRPHITGLVLIGAADQQPLKPQVVPALHSNAEVALQRATKAADEIRAQWLNAAPLIVTLPRGAQYFGISAAAPDQDTDRSVQLCVVWD